MHESSFKNMEYCFNKYTPNLPAGTRILDVGGRPVNKKGFSYKTICDNLDYTYVSLDIVDDPAVDIFTPDPYNYPLDNDSIDVIITGQVLEHSEFFWLTFNEMTRILKSGGYIFCIVPSAGKVHRFPVDCWRFYPDAYPALAKWSGLKLLEHYQDTNYWQDNVGIFIKE